MNFPDFKIIIGLILLSVGLSSCQTSNSQSPHMKISERISTNRSNKDSKLSLGSVEEYVLFFEEVYKTMDENYYQPVNRAAFENFIEKFKTKIYTQLQGEGKSDNYVLWRATALMIEKLKTSEDVFTEFMPPEPAQKFEQKVLGVRMDLGIEGKLTEQGYITTQVEPRADAYAQGLRINDIILEIDRQKVLDLTQDKVRELLNPLIDTKVKIKYLDHKEQIAKDIEVLSKEFFRQAVFPIPTKIPGIFGLEIRQFSRTTAEDMVRYLQFFKEHGPVLGLIIDLRGNPGGPPLAAREISSFFLPGGEEFAYFQKKNQPKSILDVPTIPDQYKLNVPMVVLINKGSGSASELFAGVLQRRGLAVLMGENSAGAVLLKSMFNFDDGSMLLLVTARGHHPDGFPFSFDGLTPDRAFDANDPTDLIDYASKYIIYINRMKAKEI